MRRRNYKDICGGGALLLVGGLVAFYALTFLNVGTISRMGPGMFPGALGGILALLGVAILIPAFFEEGNLPLVDIGSLVALLISIFLFAILIQPFGLIPAVVVQIVVAGRADSKLSLFGALIFAVVLALGATLVFKIALGMQIAIFSWPW